MINLNEYQLKIIISIELLNLCQTLIEADSYISDAKPIGHLCWTSNECLINSLCIRENSFDRYGTCRCIPGYIQIEAWLQCISPKHYGNDCEFNLDCQHYDPNTICEPVLAPHPLNKCLCDDYHKYDNESGLCEPCDRPECRHFRINSKSRHISSNPSYYTYFYQIMNWIYNNIFGVCVIFALPISVYFLFLGIYFIKKSCQSSGRQRNRLIDSMDTIDINQSVFVALPQPVMPQISAPISEESPPDYEDLAQTIRLPTYKEALQIHT